MKMTTNGISVRSPTSTSAFTGPPCDSLLVGPHCGSSLVDHRSIVLCSARTARTARTARIGGWRRTIRYGSDRGRT